MHPPGENPGSATDMDVGGHPWHPLRSANALTVSMWLSVDGLHFHVSEVWLLSVLQSIRAPCGIGTYIGLKPRNHSSMMQANHHSGFHSQG